MTHARSASLGAASSDCSGWGGAEAFARQAFRLLGFELGDEERS